MAEASMPAAATLMLATATPAQLDALPGGAQVQTETGKKMTAAQAKKAKKAREKKLAALKKKPPRKKGRKTTTKKPPKPVAPAPTLARAATNVMAAPSAAPSGASAASLSAAPVAAVGPVTARPGTGTLGSMSGGGAAEGYTPCGMTATQQRYLTAVNGLTSGAAFTPDSVYTLTGCGFGTRKGSVALTSGSSGGMGNVSLLIESWANDKISARVDPKLSGIADQSSVVVVVTLGDGSSLQQGGHSFAAAVEEVVLKAVPPAWLASSKLRQPATVKSPADDGATIQVTNFFESGTQFCARDVTTDVLRLSQLVLKNGYWVDRADVRSLIPAQVVQDGSDPEPALFNTYSFGWVGDDFQISPQWLQLYVPKNLFIGGYSFCQMGYEITIYLRGPRGLPPQ